MRAAILPHRHCEEGSARRGNLKERIKEVKEFREIKEFREFREFREIRENNDCAFLKFPKFPNFPNFFNGRAKALTQEIRFLDRRLQIQRSAKKMRMGCTLTYCPFAFIFVSGSRCLPYLEKLKVVGAANAYISQSQLIEEDLVALTDIEDTWAKGWGPVQ